MTDAWLAYEPVVGDDPQTTLSERAFEDAITAAGEQLGFFDVERLGAQLRVLPDHRAYLAVIVGQSSATAHGKQGLHPARLAELRASGLPVWLAFVDGGVVWSGWLLPDAAASASDDGALPAAVPISLDPARPRWGWRCADLRRRTVFEFPRADEVPSGPTTLFDEAR